MLFVRLFDGLPCFRNLVFTPVAAGFSIVFVSTYHVSEKATKESDGANALERRKIGRRERVPLYHMKKGRRLNNISRFEGFFSTYTYPLFHSWDRSGRSGPIRNRILLRNRQCLKGIIV